MTSICLIFTCLTITIAMNIQEARHATLSHAHIKVMFMCVEHAQGGPEGAPLHYICHGHLMPQWAGVWWVSGRETTPAHTT